MSNRKPIDLRSDTKTRPTPAMRAAMANAEVGDEQAGEDPTVNRLCERVAELCGKQAALFLPSGTMCNQIAAAVHCGPGGELLAHWSAHILANESGGASAIAGVQTWPLQGPHGRFDAATLTAALRQRRHNYPRAQLVVVEQTSNRGGGSVWPLAELDGVRAVADANGMAVHMDGARLLNAVVASGTSASAFCERTDSAWVDLSKGLGCPVGAVLVGSAAFIEAAWPWKFRLGGAMRQAGILAAAGLYALDHHVERLAEDHRNARRLAEGISRIDGLFTDPDRAETNLVFFDVTAPGIDAEMLARSLAARGVLVGPENERTIRVITHLDVAAEDIDTALDAMREVMAEMTSRETGLGRTAAPAT